MTKGIYLIEDFMKDPKDVLEQMKDQCTWKEFTINGNKLCRTGSFQGTPLENMSTPWLRCPSIEHQVIEPWCPIVSKIKDYIKDNLGYETNIGKIQRYENGEAFINLHSDKILDLDPETPIFVARFGADRTCVLKHKLTAEVIEVTVSNNSLLVIEYDANLIWKHGIKKDQEVKDDSYSIVFRQSVTFKHSSGYVYGKHTPCKDVKELVKYENIWDKDTYKQKIVKCYSVENKIKGDIDIYREIMEHSTYAF